MNGQAHINIMTAAFNALPALWRDTLEPQRGLLATVGNYPDYFDDPTRSPEDKAKIDPEWERFCKFPPGMDGPSLHLWPYPKTQQDRWLPMIVYWLRQAMECYQRGDFAGFMKFIGCQSHMEGDITQPAHLMDLGLLAELLPAPKGFENFHYHTDLEAVTGESAPLRPSELLGTSIEEAAWRLAARHLEDMAACRKYIVPTIQALFAGNQAEAVRLAGPPVTRAARNTADLWFTVLKLAGERISDEERKRLATIDLRVHKPDAESHDSVYGGAIVDGNRSTPPSGAPIVPALLRGVDGQIRPAKGLGMLPHSGMNGPRECWMTFGLPAGVFDRFEAAVGMHAGLTRDGAAEFIVELGGQPVFQSGRRTVHDPAVRLSIPLKQSTRLTLKVVDVNDGKHFWNNHAFWSDPCLIKNTTR